MEKHLNPYFEIVYAFWWLLSTIGWMLAMNKNEFDPMMLGFMSTNIMQNTQWKQRDIYLSEKYERINNIFFVIEYSTISQAYRVQRRVVQTEKNYPKCGTISFTNDARHYCMRSSRMDPLPLNCDKFIANLYARCSTWKCFIISLQQNILSFCEDLPINNRTLDILCDEYFV